MRVIGYIEHPTLKITVFETDTRFPVQFEAVGHVQIYRFRRGGQVENLADIKRLVDTDFCNQVGATMLRMQKVEAELWKRWDAKYGKEEDDLPSII